MLPILCLLAFPPLLTEAQQNPKNLLFIFDASGSMWQKTGNSTKIQLAKSTMKSFAEKMVPTQQVGLVAYGHTSASDCSDIETLVPLGNFDKTAFVAQIDKLNPKGKTPIAKSIQHSLALLERFSEPVNIILISDGLETCEGDACDLLEKARKAGVRITFHVIGFGIQEKDLSSLECIAQAGGGQYIPAEDAAQLATALEQTSIDLPQGDAYLSVKAVLGNQLTDAAVRVTRKGETKDIAAGRTYTASTTNPRLLQIPAGTYDIRVEAVTIRNRPTQVFENVVVKPGDTVFKEAAFDQGIVEVKVTRNGELSDATIVFKDPLTGKTITGSRSYRASSTNPVTFKIPPGKYTIEIKSVEISGGPLFTLDSVFVTGGGVLNFSHNFKSGELIIGAKNNQGYVDATIGIYDVKSGKNIGGGRTYQSASSNPKKFTVEPGTYRIELNGVKPAGLGKKTITLEVKENQATEKTVEW